MQENTNIDIKNKKRNVIKKYAFCYGLLLIPIIHFIIFWVVVNAQSLVLPFKDQYTGGFTLWGNFERVFKLFKANGELSVAFVNTLKYYFVHLISGYVIAPFFSYCLFKKIAGYKLFSILFMIPMIVSTVVMVAIFKSFLGENGLFERIYHLFTDKPFPALLASTRTATDTIIAYVIWTGFGTNLVLFSGAMTKIDPEIIECTELEGVGFFREFFSIEFPLIWPTLSMSLLLSINSIFSASGPIIYFTNGAAGTKTISFWFYQEVFKNPVHKNLELSAAFGLLLTLGGAPLVILAQWLRKKIPAEAY